MEIYMRKKLMIIGLLPIMIILFIRCSDTTGTDGNNFSIKIIVKDLDGVQIEGLDIGFSNKILYIPSEYRTGSNIYYSLHQDCFLSLKIYDLSESLIKTLIYSEQPYSGIGYPEFINWDGTDNYGNEATFGGTAVYKMILKAYDLETNEILFEDIKYICHDKSIYDQECFIGATNDNGVFETNNKQLFPNFFDPPIMNSYDEYGTYLGEFSLNDTIEILLYDQINELIDIQEKVINEGENIFELIWTPEKNNIMDLSANKIEEKDIKKTHSCRECSVELTAYQATMQDEFVAISWITEIESDMSYFNIYRNELLIHTEEATNSDQTTEYTFIDEEVVDGETYVYDLEAVCLDGTVFIIGSTTITVEFLPPVTLSHFSAEYAAGNLVIYWTTQSESDNTGWNIYRGESEDAYLNDETLMINTFLIPGSGTTSQPTEYTYEDQNEVIENNTYWYWLESVSGSGITDIYGPISLTIPEDPIPEPGYWELIGNFPNPFK